MRAGRTDADAGRGEAARRRPRFTGRALVLVLVLAALVASYASSLRAYVDQRQHVAALEEQIDRSRDEIDELQREKKRWQDDAYVVAQARARFAFGFPGEVGYQVLDEEGKPLDGDAVLPGAEPPAEDDPEWWETTLDSVEVAGDPPRTPPRPVGTITTPPDLRSPRE